MVQKPPIPDSKLDDQGNVLSNAARLFREKGFEKTSLKEIAEACNMLPGSLYYRYNTKEALLVELMRRGILPGNRREVELAYASSNDPVEKLRLCINAHLRALLGDSDMVYVLLFEWRALSPEARKEIIKLRDQYESLWIDILETMISQRVIQKDVDSRLLRLIGLGALNWLQHGFDPNGSHTPNDIGNFVWQAIIKGLINQMLQGEHFFRLKQLNQPLI